MNLPNKLTLFRLILTIPLVVFLLLVVSQKGDISFFSFNLKTIYFLISGSIFVVAMLTDWIDGFLARKNNQVTGWGKLFDPVADKFITTIALIFLTLLNLTFTFLLIIFVLRDILVGALRVTLAQNDQTIAASWLGKAKTMIMSISLTAFFFIMPFFNLGSFQNLQSSLVGWLFNIPLIVGAILSLWSAYQYLQKAKPYL